MKILIFHQHFRTPNQGGSLRSYYIAKGLANYGHNVCVIAGLPNNIHPEVDFNEFKVQYLRNKYDNSYGFIRRLISYASFLIKSLYTLSQYKDCDLIYTMSTPLSVGIIGLYCRFVYRIPYVFEAGDLWPDVPIQMGIIKNSFLKGLTLRLEKSIYSNAAFVVALSTPMQKLILEKVNGCKVIVVENFADLDSFQSGNNQRFKLPFNIPEKGFVISYVGTLGIANKVEKIIDLAAAVRDNNIHFIIQGQGKDLSLCIKKAKSLGLKNVYFIPFGNKRSVQELLKISDAVFVSFDINYPLLTTGCPNKLIDGLAAGKVVLINYYGWQKDLIQNNSCGAFIDTYNLSKGKSTLLSIVNRASLVNKMKVNSSIVARSYSIDSLIPKLNDEILRIKTTDQAYSPSY